MSANANAEMPNANGRHVVCVTGANGYIASWLVKLLLERGYFVRGTVRNPEAEKNAHLKALKGAEERLTLVKAHLMDYESLYNAINGCQGVFHLASPLTDDPVSDSCAAFGILCGFLREKKSSELTKGHLGMQEEMLEPAVKGARNVMDASAAAGVRRVVFTSSIGAVHMNPHRPPEQVVDETCWSDLEFCKSTKNWYCYGKMVAEKAAWETAKEKGVDLVVVIPSLVLGPLLQSEINVSAQHVAKYLDGSAKTYANAVQAYVHVRDVAEVHILVYENPSSCGRYLCAESVLHRGDVVEILAELFPQYPLPTQCSDKERPRKSPFKVSNQRLKDLGLEFTPTKQTLYETVISLQEKGHISKYLNSKL